MRLLIQIPFILRLPPSPKLEFESPVSFGISIPDGLVLTRFVDIKNNGKRAGNFRIDYAGDQPIKIFPCVGTIEPDCSRSIKVWLGCIFTDLQT